MSNFPEIPKDLAELVPPNLDPVSSSTLLPNYNEYFDRVFLLHDDVLGPYLVKLKDYFEEVQVYLGKIEAWLSTSQSCLDFLNSIFEDDDVARFIRHNEAMRPREHILLQWSSGNYQETFDITRDEEREQVKKFIEFIKLIQ